MSRYTYARLEYALKVFRDSEPYRKGRGLEAKNLDQFLKRYDTRNNCGPFVARRTGIWVDKDDSGDYVPGLEKKRGSIVTPKPCLTKRKADKDGWDEEGKKRATKIRGRTWQRGRQCGEVKKVTFKLHFKRGKELLRKIWSEAQQGEEGSDDGSDVAGLSPRKMSSSKDGLDKDPSSLSFATRRRSSANLEKDDGDDFGSFSIRLRTREVPAATQEETERKYAACDQCRHAKKRCSLKKKSQTGPCHSCRRDIFQCTFHGVDRNEQQVDSNIAGESISHPITISSPPHDAEGYTKTITTHWCHPVDYKFRIPPDLSKLCHFCSQPRYAIFGPGLVTIEVIAYPGSVAYEELGGGLREEGLEPTRMCISCGIDRLRISRCEQHEIFPFGDCEENTADKMAAFFALRDNKICHTWCSLCANLAYFRCGSKQTWDRSGRSITPNTPADQREGCGLCLCSKCASDISLYGMSRRILETMIKKGGRDLRADYDFLFRGSDLHIAYGA